MDHEIGVDGGAAVEGPVGEKNIAGAGHKQAAGNKVLIETARLGSLRGDPRSDDLQAVSNAGCRQGDAALLGSRLLAC